MNASYWYRKVSLQMRIENIILSSCCELLSKPDKNTNNICIVHVFISSKITKSAHVFSLDVRSFILHCAFIVPYFDYVLLQISKLLTKSDKNTNNIYVFAKLKINNIIIIKMFFLSYRNNTLLTPSHRGSWRDSES